MKNYITTILALSALSSSTAFAWNGQKPFWFDGNKGSEATNQTWSLINNWREESTGSMPGYLPGTSTDQNLNEATKVYFGTNSNKNGGQYIAGVTDVLNIDVDVKMHQFQIQNRSDAITNVRAVEDGSLTFVNIPERAGEANEHHHATIIMDNFLKDFRIGSSFSVDSAKLKNGAAAHPYFWQRASKNLYLGAADGMSTITINAYEGTSSTGQFEFHFKGAGDIVLNGKLTTNVMKGSDKLTAMVFIRKNGVVNSYGSTVFQASQTNDIDTITVTEGLTAVFDMKNGAKAVAEKNTRSNFNSAVVSFRENSTIRFDGNNQLQTTTIISPKVQSGTALSAGLIDLNNTSQEAGMLRVWMALDSNSCKFDLDFGDEKNTANTLKLHDSFLVAITDYNTPEAPIFDPTTSKFLIKNFEQGKDQFLVKNKISDEVLSAVYFDGAGTKGVDYEVVQTQLSDGFWSLTYNAIPEPSTYAMIFGAIALGFVAYRRR